MTNGLDIKSIYRESQARILLLDGGLGTMVQGYGLCEEDYRGARFAGHGASLRGCNDVLTLTRPDVIAQIHEAYLRAGADIISTDTFNATSVSLVDYGLEDFAYEINRAGAEIARRAADKYSLSNPHKPRFVAGSMGPTNRSASMSADIGSPASRAVTFGELAAAYEQQVEGLLDGGVDILLVETIFDTLNAKAALFAIDAQCEKRGIRVPVMVSGTIADSGGRTLSGQTVEAYYVSLRHADLFSIGLNCGFGAKQLRPFLSRLAAVAGCRISVHPNAGLPNVMGGYDETPAMFGADIEEYLREGIVNVVGGCCGTTPLHIAALAALTGNYTPRPLPTVAPETQLSGLEPLTISRHSNFVNIGERANVAGSAKFARLIREDQYEQALTVARQQVEAGAQIIDVCMDDGMIDSEVAMTKFLNYAMSEPEIARVPIVIDSSSWEVLEAGLQCVQGKCLVNSISLKEGEEEFVRRARLLMRYGAAAVVMLFDEAGQADVLARKIEVARRAYDILTGIGFPPTDIVFDPNVLAVGTGIEQHDNYGVDFIEACAWIKQHLPHAKVSGGVSNLSFSFRGNNPIREAMHSVFLYHAIAAGMDMGIVNPALLQVYSDIEPRLLELTEDLVLNRRVDATQRLTEYAGQIKERGSDKHPTATDKWREESTASRIAYAMIKGADEFIEQDVMEAYRETGAPMDVIDRYLMPAINHVGLLFGQGKMFLPQVVKSARVMRKAVDLLTPYIEAGRQGAVESSGRVLIATVKGDVHDIGKNIVSVVMSCGGYEIEDLGVMVECEQIVDAAVEWEANVIGLSGLITPSLFEMTKVVRELQRRGLKIPVIIGGATTSALHTAVKIAPHYDGLVVRCADAAENIRILPVLLHDLEALTAKVKAEQLALRTTYEQAQARQQILPLAQARKMRHVKSQDDIIVPGQLGRVVFRDYPIEEVLGYIDWSFFFPAWEIRGHYPELLDSDDKGPQARKLLSDARAMLGRIEREGLLRLSGVVGIFEAVGDSDDIVIKGENGAQHRFPQLRSQEANDGKTISLSDFVVQASDGTDYIAAFVVTAGGGLSELAEGYRSSGDDYSAIMCKLLADRLAEAFAERLHLFVRQTLWAFEREDGCDIGSVLAGNYQGARIAIGYPACPDHSQKRELFELLDVEAATGMRLTESYMIDPAESVCGFILADPSARYFGVGRIGDDQLADYAARRGVGIEEISKQLSKQI